MSTKVVTRKEVISAPHKEIIDELKALNSVTHSLLNQERINGEVIIFIAAVITMQAFCFLVASFIHH